MATCYYFYNLTNKQECEAQVSSDKRIRRVFRSVISTNHWSRKDKIIACSTDGQQEWHYRNDKIILDRYKSTSSLEVKEEMVSNGVEEKFLRLTIKKVEAVICVSRHSYQYFLR